MRIKTSHVPGAGTQKIVSVAICHYFYLLIIIIIINKKLRIYEACFRRAAFQLLQWEVGTFPPCTQLEQAFHGTMLVLPT